MSPDLHVLIGKFTKAQIHLQTDVLELLLIAGNRHNPLSRGVTHLPDYTVNEPSFLPSSPEGCNGNSSHYNYSTNAFKEI